MSTEPGNSEIFYNLSQKEYADQPIDVINRLAELDDNEKRYANMSVNEALEIIRNNFEGRENPEKNLDYHNSQHTLTVIERTIKILNAMKCGGANITDQNFLEAIIAAAFHDVIQDYKVEEISENKFKKKVRRRNVGQNEEKSAELAKKFMERVNSQVGKLIFDHESINRVVEAIMVTVPGFDVEKQTVIQPNLNEKSHPIAIALALADLGTSGMDGYYQFLQEGDALFREDNIDIREALIDSSKITDEEKEFYRQRIIKWIESQVNFARGRKSLFESQIGHLPTGVQEELRKLFNNFDNTINGMEKKVKARRELSFEELIKDMGY